MVLLEKVGNFFAEVSLFFCKVKEAAGLAGLGFKQLPLKTVGAIFV